jgi:hypothetical protein
LWVPLLKAQFIKGFSVQKSCRLKKAGLIKKEIHESRHSHGDGVKHRTSNHAMSMAMA